MRSHARVVVIGGGVAGCGLAYHLTRLGWGDVVLLEKAELTAGSTWHAAGNIPHFAHDPLAMRIQHESSRIYARLEAETGRAVGLHRTGSIRIATDEALMIEHRRVAAMARGLDVPFELVGPEKVRELFPHIETDGVLGAAWTPADGHIDPSSLTNALAGGARDAGAEIYRHTTVTGLGRNSGGEWRVETDRGSIGAEVVVNAAGLWLREVAALVGYRPPAVPMERQYLVTEPVPGIGEAAEELPVLRDISAPLYLRQEGQGLLLGLFDPTPVYWAMRGTPEGFGQELLPDDLDRVSHAFERAVARVPVLGRLGVRRVINGPLILTADFNPLVGPVPGLVNFYMNGGYFAGIAQAGAATRCLAEAIVAGESEIDISAFDPRRFGAYATLDYTVSRTRAAYVHEFSPVYPHTELAGGRPARTSALYDRLAGRGAVYGARAGWEVPNWFAPAGVEPADRPSFGRANWFEHVGAECRAARDGAVLLDLTCLAKFELRGPGAAAFLASLGPGRVPAADGRTGTLVAVGPRGGIDARLLITRLAPDRFYLTGAAAAETRDHDLLARRLPADLRLDNVSGRRGVLLLAGPRAGDVLAKLTRAALGTADFPPGAAREITVGWARVLALRLSATGEPAFELHHDIGSQLALYDALMDAGAPYDIRDIGMRAFDSMRLEKGRPRWGADIGPFATPAAAGLVPACDEAPRRLACLVVAADGADAAGAEPVFHDGACVSVVTSGGYGHRVEQSLAFAYLPAALTAPGTELAIEILGEPRPAVVRRAPVYDPRGERPRG